MSLGYWFRRKWLKLYNKMVGEKATPEYIARGWAIGMFFGCFAPIGTQLVLSIPTAFTLKGSKIGAVFGTLLTNHVTIWFIYPAQCWFGNKMLGRSISYEAVKSAMDDLLHQQSWQALMDLGGDVLEAFLLGGFVMAIVLTPITYYLVKRLVVRYRAERANHRGIIQLRILKKLKGKKEEK